MRIKLPKMTLIEWMVVLAIVGILATLIFGGDLRIDGLDSCLNLD